MENTEAAPKNQILTLSKLGDVWRLREVNFCTVLSPTWIKKVCKQALGQVVACLNWWSRNEGWDNLKSEEGRENGKRKGGRKGKERERKIERQQNRDRKTEKKEKLQVAWEAGLQDRKQFCNPWEGQKFIRNTSNIHFPNSSLSAFWKYWACHRIL